MSFLPLLFTISHVPMNHRPRRRYRVRR